VNPQAKQKPSPFPLRVDPELRKEAERLAKAGERSLNWVLGRAIRLGIQQMKAA
jgi:predicted HicB family RNase H-like nuclease